MVPAFWFLALAELHVLLRTCGDLVLHRAWYFSLGILRLLACWAVSLGRLHSLLRLPYALTGQIIGSLEPFAGLSVWRAGLILIVYFRKTQCCVRMRGIGKRLIIASILPRCLKGIISQVVSHSSLPLASILRLLFRVLLHSSFSTRHFCCLLCLSLLHLSFKWVGSKCSDKRK